MCLIISQVKYKLKYNKCRFLEVSPGFIQSLKQLKQGNVLKCSCYAILRLLILFYECPKTDLHAYKIKKH